MVTSSADRNAGSMGHTFYGAVNATGQYAFDGALITTSTGRASSGGLKTKEPEPCALPIPFLAFYITACNLLESAQNHLQNSFYTQPPALNKQIRPMLGRSSQGKPVGERNRARGRAKLEAKILVHWYDESSL
mmetsp:Transcript_16335/g.44751  ORF Transcript_16335/g.44751 Transcript_16335/m.44751 type:complete len:133 (-) Transcript_16335:383-781(-)